MTQHADALAVLAAWSAPDDAQERLRAEYVAHLEANPDGCSKPCFPDHLTAGALVLSDDGRQVLLNLHRKARRWFAFGGHIEPEDPTLAAAALREATEEMLLWMSSGRSVVMRFVAVGGEDVVDLACDESFQAADDVLLGQTFFGSAFHVCLGARVPAQSAQGDAVERGVGLSIAAAVEPVAVGLAG